MISEAQMKAVAKYQKENYDFIKIRVPKGMKEVIKQQAQDQGLSMNDYIVSKILTTELTTK